MNVDDVVVCKEPCMNSRGGTAQIGDIGLVVSRWFHFECTLIVFGESVDQMVVYMDEDQKTLNRKWEKIGEL